MNCSLTGWHCARSTSWLDCWRPKGDTSSLPPLLAFPVSPPHLLMLEAGAFHRLLNPHSFKPGVGISSAACWPWLWRLGCLASPSPALSLAQCLGSASASTSPRRRQVQSDTVILRAETILLYLANLNDHKDPFQGKPRQLCCVRFSPLFRNISSAFA